MIITITPQIAQLCIGGRRSAWRTMHIVSCVPQWPAGSSTRRCPRMPSNAPLPPITKPGPATQLAGDSAAAATGPALRVLCTEECLGRTWLHLESVPNRLWRWPCCVRTPRGVGGYVPQQESPRSPATTAVQPQTEAVPSQGWAVRPPGKCDRVCVVEHAQWLAIQGTEPW